jgi:hypothetical protein
VLSTYFIVVKEMWQLYYTALFTNKQTERDSAWAKNIAWLPCAESAARGAPQQQPSLKKSVHTHTLRAHRSKSTVDVAFQTGVEFLLIAEQRVSQQTLMRDTKVHTNEPLLNRKIV